MRLLILSVLVATGFAAPAAQSLVFQDDGSYRFFYETGEEGGSHSRTEVRNPDGVVIGKFSYQDPDGEIREVNYRADESGFVAKGDVGVKGAPKGQFPVPQDNQPQEEAPSATTITEEQATEPKNQPQAGHVKSYHDEEDNDIQDLSLDESPALDDPPEGFPPGFFLEKFQGLRRFPDPTKEEKVSTTETPKVQKEPVQPESTEAADDKKEATATKVKTGGPSHFAPLQPFHALSPHEWASSMFHQPVYVFSYHQPDSYGYHYFF